MTRIGLSAWLLLGLLTAPVSAQGLPSSPVQLFDGRVRIGGEITASASGRDEEAFFNYTDYERNALRTLRLAVTGHWQPVERMAFLAQVRTEDLQRPQLYAAYVRLRPLAGIPLDIQAGRIPPVFGAYGRRGYGIDQMVIGYPLAYQYLTSLRPDAVPATVDDLLRMRGRGWRSNFPVGALDAQPGVPLISAFRWDTGVQAHWSTTVVDTSVAVTTGTLSNPRASDDNGGRQLAARVAARPVTGLVAGASVARGAWAARTVPGATDAHAQTAFGADAEYSRGYWLVRSELVWSRWRLPWPTPPPDGPDLDALGAWIEGRYRLTPRLYLAARADRLNFSRLTGPDGTRSTWDAPVTRVEAGAGYRLERNLLLNATVQVNRRDGGRIEDRTFVAMRVAWWF